MARSVLIPFYDPQAAGLAPSALRAQLVNPDGTPSGALISTGFASVNGTPDQFVWSGIVGDYFEGVVQFKTDAGRVLGSSDLPTTANDAAKAVWEYPLPSGADAGAAIDYIDSNVNQVLVAANEAIDAANDAGTKVWNFEFGGGDPASDVLHQAAADAGAAVFEAQQAKIAANDAGAKVWNYADGIFTNVGLSAGESLDNIRGSSAVAQEKSELLEARLPDTRAAKLDNVAQVGSAMTLTTAAMNATADALLDRAGGVETGLTLRQTLRIMSAVLFGKSLVNGNHVQFLRRDGTTAAVTVDFTDVGARPVSTIGSV